MFRFVEKTISAIVYDLAGKAAMRSDLYAPPYGDVTEFVIEQLRRMPEFLAVPIQLATAAFGASRLLREGSFYHSRSPARRKVQLGIWSESALGPCRDLVRFYDSLITLALYSRHSFHSVTEP